MPYNKHFISGKPVALPKLPAAKRRETAPLLRGGSPILHYPHYSVVLNGKRKFAFFSACNINGKEWKNITRKGVFIKDKRTAAGYQYGNELYSAIKGRGLRPNDFQQGHLTAFQQVLWGKTAAERNRAAAGSFYFTNCVPQHARLNVGLWRSLEQYILKTQTLQHHLRVSVITGPLFSDQDPYYIKKINGQYVKLPCTFWKVVYYPNKRGLNAVGFMMSHTRLLLQDGTVTFNRKTVQASGQARPVADTLFMDYKYDAVYQVRVELIQEKTGLQFMLNHVHLPYQQHVKKSVLYKRIEVQPAGVPKPGLKEPLLDYKLKGITL